MHAYIRRFRLVLTLVARRLQITWLIGVVWPAKGGLNPAPKVVDTSSGGRACAQGACGGALDLLFAMSDHVLHLSASKSIDDGDDHRVDICGRRDRSFCREFSTGGALRATVASLGNGIGIG